MKRITQISAVALLLALILLPGFASANTEAPAGDDYAIVLQARTFTPDPGSSIQRSAGAPEARWHGLLQLHGAPSAAERALLSANGVQLLHYIPDNAWLASLPGDAARLPAQLGVVRWVGELAPADKLDLNLLDPAFVAGKSSDGHLALWIQLFPDVDWEAALARLALLGAISEAEPTTGQLILTAPAAALWQVAGEDAVAWVLDARSDQETLNMESRIAAEADVVQAPPYGLSGLGTQVGIWDNGQVAAHPDFDARLTNLTTRAAASHATNVAGTVAGSGAGSVAAGYVEGKFTGYAYGAELYAHYFSGVIPAHDVAINTYGIDVSQNSWGYTSCTIFGAYSIYAADYDDISHGRYGNPIPVVFAAGNTNGSCGETYTTVLGGPSSAKNVIVVGATDESGSAMAGFSAWGPTTDGRTKPELVAVGTSVASTCTEDGYCGYSGTSQAAPAVSGSIALLLERYHNVCTADSAPLPSTYRALLVHTADDMASGAAYLNPGPDFASGYGQLNTHAAVDTLPYHVEGALTDGVTDSYSLVVNAQDSLKVTLAWDDAPAAYNAAVALINDLDLELVAPDGTVHGPWLLDPTPGNQANPAQRPTWSAGETPQRDDRNVLEQVVVDNPQDGVWTVRIIGSNVPAGPQSYTLVSEQLDAALLNCQVPFEPVMNPVSAARANSDVVLSWNHVAGNESYEIWANNSPLVDPELGAGMLLATVDGSGLSDGAALSYTDVGVIDGQISDCYYAVRAVNGGAASALSPLVAKIDQSIQGSSATWVTVNVEGIAATASALQAHIEANSSGATTVSHIERFVDSTATFHLFAAQPFALGDFPIVLGNSYRVVVDASVRAGESVTWTQVGALPAGSPPAPQATHETGLVNNFRYGQVTSLPTDVNYVAWIAAGSGAPAEVLTDNAFNAEDGLALGYQSSYWLLNLANFSTVPATTATLQMVFGGEGAAAGSSWTYATALDGAANHGIVGAPAAGSCPTLQGVSLTGGGRSLNWSGAAGTYNIYRTTIGSGIAAGSNGRFTHVGTVYSAGPNHTFVDPGTATAWYLVVPADAGGAISGCRSNEMGILSPTAITFAGVDFAPAAGSLATILFISGLLAAATLLLVARATRRRRTTRQAAVSMS